ncbi:hypothetical protein J6590_047655, partial [Homalodisca vitripennis]
MSTRRGGWVASEIRPIVSGLPLIQFFLQRLLSRRLLCDRLITLWDAGTLHRSRFITDAEESLSGQVTSGLRGMLPVWMCEHHVYEMLPGRRAAHVRHSTRNSSFIFMCVAPHLDRESAVSATALPSSTFHILPPRQFRHGYNLRFAFSINTHYLLLNILPL